MPYSPRTLRRPGTQAHQPRKHNWKTRGTKASRGYGTDWEKVRDAYIAEHGLCERCESKGVVKPAEEVHHRIAFKGIDDPLRLAWDNLMSVCIPCHRASERERQK